jgi:hypothetical protein
VLDRNDLVTETRMRNHFFNTALFPAVASAPFANHARFSHFVV